MAGRTRIYVVAVAGAELEQRAVSEERPTGIVVALREHSTSATEESSSCASADDSSEGSAPERFSLRHLGEGPGGPGDRLHRQWSDCSSSTAYESDPPPSRGKQELRNRTSRRRALRIAAKLRRRADACLAGRGGGGAETAEPPEGGAAAPASQRAT
ncbi:unnamed protein product, partial [Prorocentrum cordatum]